MATPTSFPSSISGQVRSGPCAACKHQRRNCTPQCILAPYIPASEPQNFVNVHKIFGASNVTKILSDLPVWDRSEAVKSLAYEAEVRVRDPSLGCVQEIFTRQESISQLEREIDHLVQNINALAAKGVRPSTTHSYEKHSSV